MQNIEPLIKKYKTVGGLSDMELMILAERTGKASNILYGMGDLFALAAHEANRIFVECFDFAIHRGLLKREDSFNVEKITVWITQHKEEK